MRHAEKIKTIGAGLLSESNHVLKNDIAETNAILERVAHGLEEVRTAEEDFEESLFDEIVEFVVVKYKQQYPDITPDELAMKASALFLTLSKAKSVVRSDAKRMAKKTGLERQIKRGL